MPEDSGNKGRNQSGALNSTIYFLGSLQLAGIVAGAGIGFLAIAYLMATEPKYVLEVVWKGLTLFEQKVDHAAPITAGIFLSVFKVCSWRSQNDKTPILNYLVTVIAAVMFTIIIIFAISINQT